MCKSEQYYTAFSFVFTVILSNEFRMICTRFLLFLHSQYEADFEQTAADAAQQTSKVIEGVRPVASSTVDTILAADPVVIAATGGAIFVAYLLLPPVLSAISFNFRGYKGEFTPAQTLDLVCTTNHVLIDIRSEKDKDKAGIPRLPSNAKNKLIAVPLEELPSKSKGIVRNVKKLEAEIAALKISYLKKINKGSNIVIMDS
ncbi:Calcium sensing receptor chloroplastic [Euphorbia peplus]|nr:Calcium sensing receptor chloroplastic [Euphorbia peplus]